jgi:hypothetical protein
MQFKKNVLPTHIHSHSHNSSSSRAVSNWQHAKQKVKNVYTVPFLMIERIRQRRQEDTVRTALQRWQHICMTKCFNAWKAVTEASNVNSAGGLMPPMPQLTRQLSTSTTSALRGKCGLRNLGNTCYMNAVLQALASSENLSEHMMLSALNAPKPTNERAHTQETTLTGQLTSVLQVLCGGKRVIHTPDELLQTIWRLNQSFVGFKQQDAHELAIFILNKLVEEQGTVCVCVWCGVCGISLHIDTCIYACLHKHDTCMYAYTHIRVYFTTHGACLC